MNCPSGSHLAYELTHAHSIYQVDRVQLFEIQTPPIVPAMGVGNVPEAGKGCRCQCGGRVGMCAPGAPAGELSQVKQESLGTHTQSRTAGHSPHA